MCLLLESIKIENHKLVNLDYHQERAMKSRKRLFDVEDDFDLQKSISIPENLGNGIFKCRVLYGMKIEKIEFLPYNYRQINTLKLVFDDQVDYAFKYADRSGLNRLFENRGDCDDILIVKNGLVTDTSYSNILFLKKGRWYTPDKPLLEGTKRDYLISTGKIIAREIKISDLPQFEKFMLVNAMLDIDDNRTIEIQNIHY